MELKTIGNFQGCITYSAIKKNVVLNLTFEMLVACGAFVALRHTYFFREFESGPLDC